jgi:hypothetical protein
MVGAVIERYDIVAVASAEGLVIVGGECPTVGLAGGYTQGGGHSALSPNFGLAADQTLEFQVVRCSLHYPTADLGDWTLDTRFKFLAFRGANFFSKTSATYH